MRSLKALAFAHLKRFDDSLVVLRAVMEIDRPNLKQQTFPRDTIEEIKILFAETSNKEIQEQFEKLLGQLEKHGHICDDSIDSILCANIKHYVRPEENAFTRNDYQRKDDFNPRRPRYRDDFASERNRRPGLHELY